MIESLAALWTLMSTPGLGQAIGVGTAVATATGVAVKAVLWTHERLTQRVQIKEIDSSEHKDFPEFVELYDRTIEESTRITPTEIAAWLDNKNHKNGLDYTLLLCKKGEEILGFAQLMHIPGKPYSYISYFGIDNQKLNARKQASARLAAYLRKIVAKKISHCLGVYFEVQSPYVVGLELQEVHERIARSRRFKDLVRVEGGRAYEIDMQYIAPEVPGDVHTLSQHEMRLMYFVLDKSCERQLLPKPELIEAIRFLYLDIYGLLYKDDVELNDIYRSELDVQIGQYEATLPENIRLIP